MELEPHFNTTWNTIRRLYWVCDDIKIVLLSFEFNNNIFTIANIISKDKEEQPYRYCKAGGFIVGGQFGWCVANKTQALTEK